jgi:hypothetical protein
MLGSPQISQSDSRLMIEKKTGVDDFMNEVRNYVTGIPAGNGPGRCGTWGLRVPTRCRNAH